MADADIATQELPRSTGMTGPGVREPQNRRAVIEF
jgi:hypothetical protein